MRKLRKSTVAAFMTLSVISMLAAVSNSADAQRRSLDDIARGVGVGGATDDAIAQEPLRSNVFSSFRPAVKDFCSSLALDGRQQPLLEAATKLSEGAEGCRACAPLGKLVVGSCSTARPPRSYPETSFGKLQREPHPLVSRTSVGLAKALAEDASAGSESAIFFALLGDHMSKSESLSLGAKEYFSVLNEGMGEQFKHLNKASADESSTGGVPSAPIDDRQRQRLLDEMF
jgi:hypothetical protein